MLIALVMTLGIASIYLTILAVGTRPGKCFRCEHLSNDSFFAPCCKCFFGSQFKPEEENE